MSRTSSVNLVNVASLRRQLEGTKLPISTASFQESNDGKLEIKITVPNRENGSPLISQDDMYEFLKEQRVDVDAINFVKPDELHCEYHFAVELRTSRKSDFFATRVNKICVEIEVLRLRLP